ncbi:MAG: hypothetical protein H6670_11950 [Anaerolineaceae bacterium]|nr:hypothetical protein [Anaerolineaceae bacterium]
MEATATPPSTSAVNEYPTEAEFLTWEHDAVRPHTTNKSVIFSPGGSSRWYFLEYGNMQEGYFQPDRFMAYSKAVFKRIVEIASMMMADGVKNVFIIAITPKISERTPEYRQFVADSLRLMADQEAQLLYAEASIRVGFKGRWQEILDAYEIPEVYNAFTDAETATADGEHNLFWCTQEDPIPAPLTPFVQEYLQTNNRLPNQSELCEAYYGETVTHADMFISNNKPSVTGQVPPLLSVGDLYFTMSPCLYLNQSDWRRVLYDHVFARRVTYRDYRKITEDSVNNLKNYYDNNRGKVIGVGAFHPDTQTWRPTN